MTMDVGIYFLLFAIGVNLDSRVPRVRRWRWHSLSVRVCVRKLANGEIDILECNLKLLI